MISKLTCAVLVAAGYFNAASAATIVTDAVPTDTGASIDRTIDGVSVTGANLNIIQPGNTNVDPTAVAWGGNEFTYVIADINTDAAGGGLGNLTYQAPVNSYFEGFDARVIGNRGQLGDGPTNTLSVFTFEGSTDGVNFSPIAVTGTEINGTGLDADWERISAVPTAALEQLTHLRIGMNVKASGGAIWHQQFGAVSMDVVTIPEPTTALLGGLGLLLLLRRRR